MVTKQTLHSKGQYFTTNEYLKQCVYKLILNKPSVILEPSMGRGDLIDFVLKKNNDIDFDLYEIDPNIKMLPCINRTKIHFGDFLSQKINIKYTTIIGNPPYVKTKTGNLYLDFIKKCYDLLEINGELIFIVPSDFIKLTSSGKIINEMLQNGTFTHIYHPNMENLFSNASIDVIIFRYCKNKSLSNKILHNDENKYLINTNGILTFSNENKTNFKTINDYFKVYVGLVTGKEKVYKNGQFGNIELLNGKEKKEKYILLEDFPTANTELNKYMLSHKKVLISRKIKKFNENNWWKWGAPRNKKSIEKYMGQQCIYISNLTRRKEVAFIDKVQYFGGGLIILIPNKKMDLQKIVTYLNSETFKSNYMYSGRFKIGHKQLCNGLLQINIH